MNINLSSPEADTKQKLSGKSALLISVSLLIVVLIVQGYLSYEKGVQVKKRNATDGELVSEKEKMSAQNYGNLVDFVDRLALVSKTMDERIGWEGFFRNLSKYVIPEVYFRNVVIEDNKVIIKGTATNLDTLSREIILLKSFSETESIEFKGATEKLASDGRGGVDFEVSLKVKGKTGKE